MNIFAMNFPDRATAQHAEQGFASWNEYQANSEASINKMTRMFATLRIRLLMDENRLLIS